MKAMTVTENDAGQRLDRLISKVFPSLPRALMYKEIRKKNIKVNKKRCEPDYKVNAGDLVELYIKDELLEEKKVYYDFMRAPKDIHIIYEDKNLILVDKKPGQLCHPDGSEYINTLISAVKRYLYEKGEWKPDGDSFSPALANRLDRNTGGIIIAAKNARALKALNDAIKNRDIEKHYLAAVHGHFEKENDTLTAYLTKDESKNKVSISEKEIPGGKKIVTKYRVLDRYDSKTLLDIDLITGRTHQIRAHLAHIGHPLINDGKYGREAGRFRQALYSYRLIFCTKAYRELAYLDAKEFTVKNCEVYKKFKERSY